MRIIGRSVGVRPDRDRVLKIGSMKIVGLRLVERALEVAGCRNCRGAAAGIVALVRLVYLPRVVKVTRNGRRIVPRKERAGSKRRAQVAGEKRLIVGLEISEIKIVLRRRPIDGFSNEAE